MASEHSEGEVLFNGLVDEFAQRYRRGERPSVQEYTDRYPQLAEQIRDLFPALAEIEQVKEEQRAPDPTGVERSAASLPRQLGDYRIVREVGRGGMGVVYEAEQVSLSRRVALKVLPLAASRDATALERFKREARAAARLHHTNIVPVFDVGQEGDAFFYAMQFIAGQPLDQVIGELRRLRQASGGLVPRAGDRLAEPDGAPSPSAAALALLTGPFPTPDLPGTATAPEGAGAAAAVATEPRPAPPAVLPGRAELSSVSSNRRHYFLSVARVGQQAAQALAYAHGRGVVHRDVKPSNLLLDAGGVVWVTDFGLAKTEEDGLTRTGDLLGTLRYLAPERFDGRCDARADVYGLGLTLYELLALRPAFGARDRLRLIDQIKTEEPPRLRSLDPRIPRDLETIVLKATDRDAGRRYQTAGDLAEDLRRFAGDEPIRARRASVPERLARWARRNRALAASLAALALLLLSAAAVSTAGMVLLSAANEGERRARDDERDARRDAESRRDEARYNLYVANVNLAQREWENGHVDQVVELLRECVPAGPGDRDPRGWEWYFQDRLCRGNQHLFASQSQGLRAVAYSPDGARLAAAGDDGQVRLWDAAGGEPRILASHAGRVYALAYSPDGARLAAAGDDGRVRLWDVAGGGEPRTLAGHAKAVEAVAFSPDGKRLASAGRDSAVRLWEVADGREVRVLQGRREVNGVAFSPDGTRLAAAEDGATVRVWDVAGGRELQALRGPVGEVRAVAFSPDGTRLAAAGQHGLVLAWDLEGHQEPQAFEASGGSVHAVTYSPDGTRLAAAGADGAVRVWEVAGGEAIRVYRGHRGPAWGVAYSPDGTRLASAGEDGTVRLWDAAAGGDLRTLKRSAYEVFAVTFHPDGRRLASATSDHLVQVWDPDGGEPTLLRGHARSAVSLAFRPDGARLASAGRDDTVRVWDVAAAREVLVISCHQREVNAVAYSPDGQTLASAGDDRTVRVWDAADGRERHVLRGHSDEVRDVKFSPDGARLASTGLDSTVRVWDAAEGRQVYALEGGSGHAYAVAFSPDGARLASASEDGAVRVWDAASGRPLRVLRGHRGGVRRVLYSPDGTRLVSAGKDGSVRVWDATDGRAVCAYPAHDHWVRCLAFSPDGTRLVSSGSDGAVRLADARPWGPESGAEHQALALLDGLFARPLLKAEVLARVRDHKGISDDVRRRALELAGRRTDEAEPFARASRDVIRHRGATAALYRQALGWAETACRLSPGDGRALTTLGLAQFRLARYGDALATLTRSHRLNGNSEPADLAFLAMAQHRLGHPDEARTALGQLREVLKLTPRRGNTAAWTFLAEAESLLAP